MMFRKNMSKINFIDQNKPLYNNKTTLKQNNNNFNHLLHFVYTKMTIICINMTPFAIKTLNPLLVIPQNHKILIQKQKNRLTKAKFKKMILTIKK